MKKEKVELVLVLGDKTCIVEVIRLTNLEKIFHKPKQTAEISRAEYLI